MEDKHYVALCDIVGDIQNILSNLISTNLISKDFTAQKMVDKLWAAYKRLDYFTDSQNLLIRKTDMRRWTYNFMSHDVKYDESLPEALGNIVGDIQNIVSNLTSVYLSSSDIIQGLVDKLWDVLKRSNKLKIDIKHVLIKNR